MESRELENRNRKKEARILNNALVYGRGNCRGELEKKNGKILSFNREIKGRIKEAQVIQLSSLLQDTLFLSRFIFYAVVSISFAILTSTAAAVTPLGNQQQLNRLFSRLEKTKRNRKTRVFN